MLTSIKRSSLAICFGLGLLTALCYGPVLSNGFVGLDDPTYILQNSHIKEGLTLSGIKWAFSSGYASNWHPVTWISHMLDIQLFGFNPGAHHAVSVFFHCCNAILVFVVLQQLTGAFWRSAIVAALFAWHPTHVESVAWAAERKDVLSTLFFLLTLWCYSHYVQAGVNGKERRSGGSNHRGLYYFLALTFFAFGLMSKPMLVTLPCVLLLLDFWPLERLGDFFGAAEMAARRGYLRVVIEKIPFFALSLIASVITFFVQRAGGAVSSLATTPLAGRVLNAFVAYSRYLLKTIWPVDLAVFYPLPDHWSAGSILGSIALLLAVSIIVFLRRKDHPYLLVGWCWFVGTLIPTIGLVQVGSQSMADRYLYIPSIGLFVSFVWGLWAITSKGEDLSSVEPRQGLALAACERARRWLPMLTCGVMGVCLLCTFLQVGYWRNEKTLFSHAAEVTTDNYLAYDHLAKVYESSGDNEAAMAYYLQLLHLKPHYPEGQYNLGTLLMNMGRSDDAIPHLEAAIQARPGFTQAHRNLGIILLRRNEPAIALEHFQLVADSAGATSEDFINLGVAELAANRSAGAVAAFRKAVTFTPELTDGQFLLALALSREHRLSEAAVCAKKARQLAVSTGNNGIIAKADELLALCGADSETQRP